MFSNVGWGEILLILIVGLVLIGPERLPSIITDVRAMILAARTAIDDARQSITGEFGEDFDELRKPLGELNELRKLNPKTALTRTLFDGDDTYLDLLSGKPAAGGGAAGAAGDAANPNPGTAGGNALPGNTVNTNGGGTASPNAGGANSYNGGANPAVNPNAGGAQAGGAHNWADDDVL
ncbi:Sec-independent protein translocase protein TatB [Corynebacterium freneyi]|uniref:Sec-independent protein translocase protein TatB n=1 Tax=Corynebacterium freneyi TaxID=134034 RepID=UPI0009FDE116|nr:Sec-independent protein translocase protein TatB [Corynebacterium freneyi]MDK8768865.1 Sec-independent protein translocase protein TatB [Corynebacterium freneyi]